MRSLTLSVAALATLACHLPAQQVVVPEGMETTYTGNTTLIWRSTAFRFQMLYDTSHFENQSLNHPITITRLRCRPINGAIDLGGQVYQGLTVKMSSSPSDYATMSTTFAANIGTDETTVFQGDLTLLPANGGAPNDYFVDITLQTPFTYSAESGLDLCVDVTAPNAPAATVPNTAASSNYLLQRARRLSTATPTAATGALSSFAAVMLFDYTVAPGTAKTVTYGLGCYDDKVSFYETFPVSTFDLGSTTSVNSILLIPNPRGGYTAVPGSNQWFTPLTADLGLPDDGVSAPQPMSFTFNYPGGSTPSIIIESNGNVWLQPPSHTSFICSTTPTALLSRGPVISGFYDDMDPSTTGGGSVHFDDDAANGVAYATWQGVPIWLASPPSPRPTNTFQVALYSSGMVELRYQGMDSTWSWTQTMCGFSPGASNRNPGPRDLSVLPFSTATDHSGLALTPSTRPVLGRTVNLVTSEIPAAAVVSATLLSLTRHDPGLPLAIIGMPDCFQYIGANVSAGIGITNPTISVAVGIPNNPGLVGLRVRSQSASIVPGANALGVITSNGVELELGSL